MTDTKHTPATFLGWHNPFPAAVARHLIARWPKMDFGSVSVIVPGGRAGRRILALLADAALAQGLPMIPPEFRTVGELPELLYRPSLPVAKTFVQQLAWIRALEMTNPQSLEKLFPRLSAGSDPASWQGAAAILDRCNDELSAGFIRFHDVLQKARQRSDLGNAERWEAAAAIHSAYLAILLEMGLCDRQQARRQAVESSAIRAPGTIVLAGVVELSRLAKVMLEPIAQAVDALIYAPPELSEGFDSFGCVESTYWFQRPVDLGDAKLRIAREIFDQAEIAFAAIAELPPEIRTDEVTIGVADEAIVPHLQTTAENLPDIFVRYGAGKILLNTRPVQLLNVIADYLESSEFRHFSVLARHPDIEDYLRSQSCADGRETPDANDGEESDIGWRDWRTLLDNYAGEYLPMRVGPEFLQIDGSRGQASSRDSAPDDRMFLAWLYGRIESLLAELRKTAVATPDEWAEPILAVLGRIYGREWDQNDERQRLMVMACKELRNGLDEIHAAGEISNRAHFSKIAAHEAIRALIGLCASRRVPPPLTGNEVEIVGWLELMPDDARRLIITGFNEGFVPESPRADPLINETVRETMNLVRDRDRLARDAYLLTAMTRSRPKGAVTLISGRRSAQGEPLLPSRLMFACDPKLMARRVLAAVDLPPRKTALALRFAHGQRTAFKIGATIPAGLVAPSDMRVTAFRDYLASPQGFYLRHILKLQTLEESAPRELDPGQCGEIVHAVLRKFADTPAAASSSKQQCLDALIGLLDAEVNGKFGTSLPGAFKFQIEMIRKRMNSLAEHQARWFGEGWRIRHAEWSPQNPANIDVDNVAMGLRGRIDRLDYHEGRKTWAVLDYKVASGEKTPEKTHQSAGGWRDLQLPLYRHLAREVLADEKVQLGYIVISDRDDCSGLSIAGWDEDMLQDADNTARQVVRDVRQCKFEAVGDSPPSEGIFAHIFGQGVLTPDDGDEAGEEAP